jgi:hypothetical protein
MHISRCKIERHTGELASMYDVAVLEKSPGFVRVIEYDNERNFNLLEKFV